MKEARRFEGDAAVLTPPSGGRVLFCGLNPPSAAYVLSESLRRNPKSYLVLMPTPIEAEDFVRDLEFFWPEGASMGAVLLCPGYEIKPFSGESPSGELVFSRLWALNELMSGRKPLVVVASAAGAMQLSMPKWALSRATEYLESGEDVDRDRLLVNLVRTGYFSTSIVQSYGDFSVRGGILDVYPPGAERPVRAEFFGDYVESLRTFRTLDQRSVAEISEQILLPGSEIYFGPGMGQKAAEALEKLSIDAGWLNLLYKPLVDKIELEEFFPGLESYMPIFYDELASVADYAGPDVVRMVFDPDRFVEAGDRHLNRLAAHMGRIVEEERPHLPLETLYLTPDAVLDGLDSAGSIEVRELAIDSVDDENQCVQFQVETHQDLRALIESSRGSDRLLAPLAARIKAWGEKGLEVVLACHTKEQARRLVDLFEDYQIFPELDLKRQGLPPSKRRAFRIVVGFLSAGFTLQAMGRAFVTEEELFGAKRRFTRRAAEEVKGIHLSSFQDLAVGDFVVHNDHGIAQYMGLVKLDVGGGSNDFLHLAYKGGDKLYVPVDRFGAVAKYTGADGHAPSLDKLGGTSWERLKAKVKASIREMADDLLKLYASRQSEKGHAFSGRDPYFREFEASFVFTETPDQMAAIDDVLKDMQSEQPMDRLVCGDVGYGKTEVALRAAFKAIHDGKQVAVLVPTTVLAEQHYQTFAQRLANYPVTVEVLSRFKKPAQQKKVLKDVSEGRVDVVVGTHRLLSKDVSFKDIGLLVIDEEHRFGVAAKEKLKKMRTQVDVLTLTATPIPRTLNMSLTGIRDLSVIETPPEDRRAIKTYLLGYDENTVCEAIAQELDRGGQVFFVHNRVKDIDMLAGRLRSLMPLVKFGVAHGQLKEQELEKIMLRFLNREIDVLITTTIIESGLDIPSANTIIINNADRFGLAQIYQLRGRVGRSNEQAHAYLFVSNPQNLTRDARKRLRALMDFTDLGAGFKIALHDLQIRGAGNMLGAAQSGQIAAVGYDMYVQLMERTIKEIKGEPLEEEFEPEIVLGMPAYIPETYVPDTDQRLEHYRRLSSVRRPEEIEEVAVEMVDRYGAPPLEVENLLMIMDLKYWLKKAHVKKMELGRSGLTLSFIESGPVDVDKVLAIVKSKPMGASLSPEGRLFLSKKGLDGPKEIQNVKNLLQGLV